MVGAVATSVDMTEIKRAEAALRESEEKYRSLFESIDEGFCIFEMIFDETGQPIDFRYIETNPGFERQTGRRPKPGQTMHELFPEAKDMWLSDYAEVALTGKPKRFVDYQADLDRWYEVFVFPTGIGEQHRLAALFSDVTERKHAEEALRASDARRAFLLKLSDTLRPLSDSAEMERMAVTLLGQELGASHVFYATMDDGGESWSIQYDYHDGVPGRTGRYPLTEF